MFGQYKSKIALNKKRDETREKRMEENLGQVHPSQLLRMKFEKDNGMISSDGSASDLEEYLSEKPKTFRSSDGFDIIEWWINNSPRFPVLAQMARDILAFPISTVASESAFSMSGRVLNDFRSSLKPKMVETLICAEDWMRSTAKAISVEEDPEEMRQLDEALAKMNVDASSTAALATGTNTEPQWSEKWGRSELSPGVISWCYNKFSCK
ncbi:zinc finger BED domain-containing protein DAYSLEEPER-like [Heracleum sosnowskyi]|uniref:Zinc finger BED domain-containing protein DAYSLEEPER-like n=1 Tax=Heracleum sosnowskyi TaxID=360622 RepID=A0AAD8N520_9APIA|nr:zinc finger BED domain-containing protein DAYSLEEPER-like [Heracleum sosnowskyi]